jgi:hypothetical protein
MCSVEIENYEVGEIGSVFVLAAEDKKLVALVEGSGVPYKKLGSWSCDWIQDTYPFERQECRRSCQLDQL